ncbi:TonB-dependent siderophore receptor [Bergeriella denitrificans]|uniref:Iron-regulated outer membrane protein FetA n=1 Tax=Bergeriella denitrificans TaxID=494 RepID=A0A378UGU6_BERDE|nr:TonB-dependent siderophore receptor [Bergeriella denitrificans]STZ76546.1 iron-regulated outer membrane protein FetA [Bergeriella denitrificans]
MKKTILAALIGNAFVLPAWANDVEQNINLNEVQVNADRQGAKIQTNIVTLREKDESTATDLRGLLAEEPAIDIGGGNGTSQFLTIRGMGQNSVDIKVDNAYSDSQILYHQGRFIVDPSMLKTISVQKGAGSASAGIGQTNGAVIAKTVDALDLLKGSDKDWGVKLNAGYASNDGRSYGATVFGRAGEYADAMFSFNRNDESDYEPGKGYTNANGGKTMPYSALDKRDYLAKIGTTIGDHRIVLSRMQNQHRGTRLVREEFAIAAPRLSLQRQAPAYRETTLTNNNIEWTANNLGFIDKLEANAYLMENKRYSADDSGCGYCGSIPGPTKTTITTKGANLNLDSRINDTLLKYGVNYRHQEIKPHAFLSRTHSLVNPTKADSGVYVEAIHDIGDFTLTGGLRYDHFNIKSHDGKSASGSKVNPSVGIIYQPTQALSFSAVHNYASRSPRLYDALMNHGRRGIVSIADGIKAERARNTEIGFNYDNGTFAADGSYFWQKISDAIANPQQRHDENGNPIEGIREAANAGYIKNKGYELNASYRNNGFRARIGVAHSKPRIYDTHPDNLLSDNPEFAVQVGRTWTAELAYRFNKPNLELGWRNRTLEKAKGSVLVRNNNGGVDEVQRASFNVNDFFANWKPTGKDNLNVNFSVNNIFNKFYYPHSQRAAVTTPPGVGRDFRLAVNYKF